MDKAGEPFRMLEKILQVFSSNDDLGNDKNVEEIISDLEKVKNKIHKYLLFQEKFEN